MAGLTGASSAARTLAQAVDRPFLWAPAALGLGIGLYFALPHEPGAVAMTAITMGTVALLFLAQRAREGGGAGAMLLFACGLAGLGVVAGHIETARHAQPMLQGEMGPVRFIGTVDDRSDREGRVRVVLSDLEAEDADPARLPRRVRISMRGPADPPPGSRISVLAVLTGPSGPALPGGFDFRRYAYFQGLGAVGYALGQPEILDEAEPGTIAVWLEGMRFAIGQRIAAHLPDQPGAVAIALLTGERGRISEETNEALRIAGLAHLLAISGLHVGLVAGLIFFALRAAMALIPTLALTWPIKKIAAFLALTGCLAYVVLVGAPVPTQRAFIMAFVVLAAVMLDRTAISLRTVAFAALIVLLFAPHSLLGPSFQLSFAAVTVLVALFEWLTWRDRPPEEGRALWQRAGRYFGGVLLTTFVVGLATLPFSLFHFSRMAPWSMAANLVGVPLTAFAIMPLGVASMAAMPFGLEGLFLVPMGWCIDLLIRVASAIAAWPEADMRLPAMPHYGLLIAVAGGLWLCFSRGRLRLLGLPLLAASLATPFLEERPALLIAADRSLIAVNRPQEGLLSLSTGRSASFVRGIWLDRMGYTDYRSWAEEADTACDQAGCSLTAAGRPVLVAFEPRAMAEDCGLPGLLIEGREGIGDCQESGVIDTNLLSRRGNLALYPLDPQGWRIKGTLDGGRTRPWSERPGQ